MRLRKIVTGLLIASTLSLSAPVLAAPTNDFGVAEGSGYGDGDGDGDGEGFGAAGLSTTFFTIFIGLTSLTLSVVAVVDSSKSP